MEYQRKKNKEASVERSVIKNSIEETDFYSEYSSFTVGIQEMLDLLLSTRGYTEVTYEPRKPSYAKYFMALLEEEQFKPYYEMTQTAGGSFTFRLKEIDLEEDEDILQGV